MPTYHIDGGKRLSGAIPVQSGKNSPIALMCAALLTKGVVRLTDITKVEEVLRIAEVLSSIGVKIRWIGEETLELDTRGPLHLSRMDREACKKVRASLLLMGALAAREKKYRLYRSGGCHLGERTTRPHVLALEKLGLEITSDDDHYDVETKGLKGGHVVLFESSDTATENVIFAAVLAKGKTTIRFASANYMVQDVCYFLRECGAHIDGIGTTTLTIDGVASLTPPTEYHPIPDPVDAMAWISLAVSTGSPLTVTGCPIEFLELELEYLQMMGQKVSVKEAGFSKSGYFRLVDLKFPTSKLTAIPDKLHPRPYPGLNIDSVPLFTPILIRAKGQSLVHDWIYENRALYALDMRKLGAKVTLLDPHRLLIEGGEELVPNTIECPPALRPGMALLIAMLATKGKSTLTNAYMIERGYGDISERLARVGARITRTP